MIGRNKSVRLDDIPGAILPYMARLLVQRLKIVLYQRDWKKAIVVPTLQEAIVR